MTDPTDTPPPDRADAAAEPAFDDATVATLEALEDVLDELREHDEHIPQWEFCEGFLTAVLCTRRDIDQAEWLPALLGGDADDPEGLSPFASAGQRTRFLMNWLAREAQLRAALQARVQSLADDGALDPATLDWRGMLQAVAASDDAPPEPPPGPVPSYAQMWALGFLAAVEHWSDEWAPPRDKDIAGDMLDALDCIAVLVDDDRGKPAFNLFDDEGPPTISDERMNDFGEALWAVYDLYDIARALGPRVAPVRAEHKVGRNDPCPCGSGKKYKKCCGS